MSCFPLIRYSMALMFKRKTKEEQAVLFKCFSFIYPCDWMPFCLQVSLFVCFSSKEDPWSYVDGCLLAYIHCNTQKHIQKRKIFSGSSGKNHIFWIYIGNLCSFLFKQMDSYSISKYAGYTGNRTTCSGLLFPYNRQVYLLGQK